MCDESFVGSLSHTELNHHEKSNCHSNETKSEKLERNGQQIINLSDRHLSYSEVEILSKCLIFCPTKTNIDPIECSCSI